MIPGRPDTELALVDARTGQRVTVEELGITRLTGYGEPKGIDMSKLDAMLDGRNTAAVLDGVIETARPPEDTT
jgi:hypothetical protein